VNTDRPAWKDPDQPTDAEKIAYYDTFIAWCGTYKLDSASSTVTHSPELAWTPSYVGSTQPRPFRLEGNPAHHHRNPRSRRSGDPEAGAGLGAAEINPLAQSF
jgi:hypothetical protein